MKPRFTLNLCTLLAVLALTPLCPATAQTGGELLVACDELYVAGIGFPGANVARINPADGALMSGVGRILTGFGLQDIEIGPDGRLYVVEPNVRVMAYNLASGVGSPFTPSVASVDDWLANTTFADVWPGNTILSRWSSSPYYYGLHPFYDAATDVFRLGEGMFTHPYGLAFGQDGYLFVSGNKTNLYFYGYWGYSPVFSFSYDLGGDTIARWWQSDWGAYWSFALNPPALQRYNGATGALYGNPLVVDPDPQANGVFGDMVGGSDGKIYIIGSRGGYQNCVYLHDPVSGQSRLFVQPDAGGLVYGTQMAFGPDGNLYITSTWTLGVKRYNGKTGDYMGDLIPDGINLPGLDYPAVGDPGRGNIPFTYGIAFAKDGDGDLLYVSSYQDDWYYPNAYPGAGSIHKYRVAINPDGVLAVTSYLGPLVATSDQRVLRAGILRYNAGRTQVSATPVTVAPTTTSAITFTEVTTAGQTSVTPLNSANTPLLENFEVATASGGFATFFDITTTIPVADVAKGVTLSIGYDATQFRSDINPTGPDPKLLHYDVTYTNPENGTHWKDITTGFDTVSHKVTGYTTSFSPFAIVKHAAYSWSGVLQPINADGSSIFKKGSTVPVKFKLTGADANVTNLNAKLYLAQVDTVDPVTTNEAVSTSAADTGNTFRYDTAGKQYLFNLSTKNLTQGTWYLRIDLGDGTNHIVPIKLKK